METLYLLDSLLFKFTRQDLTIDCAKFVSVLKKYNVDIGVDAIAMSFIKYGLYHKHALINDLCDILFCEKSNVLLSQIFRSEWNCQLTKMYEISESMLSVFVEPQDIDNCNFIKMVKYAASTVDQENNLEEIENIVKQHQLTGNMFIKGTNEFRNSTKFAYLFKSSSGYKKKKWTKIYVKIKKCLITDNISKTPAINEPFSSKSENPISKQITSKCVLEINDNKHESVYSFGLKYWYKHKWREEFADSKEDIIVKSHYDSLKAEVIDSNGKILLDTFRWKLETDEAVNRQQMKECKEYCTTDTDAIAFNIKSDTIISIEHLIALQLYCNATTEQRRFSESYRMVKYSEHGINICAIAKRHSYYAHWGRLLYEAVNVFGNRDWKQQNFYHGIDTEMLFTSTTYIYINGPLSTTSKRDCVAIDKFASPDGIAIQIDTTMNNCFNCEWISDYYDEKEFLFIGSTNPLRITSVWICRKKWICVKKYMSAINKIIEDNKKHIISVNCDESKENQYSIKTKLLQIKDELSLLSANELQDNLDKFAYKIIDDKFREDKNQLSAVGWIVKLFHCYLCKKL
eukprot:436004_1